MTSKYASKIDSSVQKALDSFEEVLDQYGEKWVPEVQELVAAIEGGDIDLHRGLDKIDGILEEFASDHHVHEAFDNLEAAVETADAM